jgi:hypothetical protein
VIEDVVLADGKLISRKQPDRAVSIADIMRHGALDRIEREKKLWGGRRRSWHLHRPHELMEVAPWPKSMISAEA